jgi:hypothetical protein
MFVAKNATESDPNHLKRLFCICRFGKAETERPKLRGVQQGRFAHRAQLGECFECFTTAFATKASGLGVVSTVGTPVCSQLAQRCEIENCWNYVVKPNIFNSRFLIANGLD